MHGSRIIGGCAECKVTEKDIDDTCRLRHFSDGFQSATGSCEGLKMGTYWAIRRAHMKRGNRQPKYRVPMHADKAHRVKRGSPTARLLGQRARETHLRYPPTRGILVQPQRRTASRLDLCIRSTGVLITQPFHCVPDNKGSGY